VVTDSGKSLTGISDALTQINDGKQLKATVFEYVTPKNLEKPKSVVRLSRSDIVYTSVQILKSGGENNLHAHTAHDGVWIVLKGRARFYGMNNALIKECGPLQGVHIPRGFYYWFENAATELLELLHIEATDKSIESQRLNAEPEKTSNIDFL
jgi:mannose-6-phosphate isomerase-like protein (cupin superfamily)